MSNATSPKITQHPIPNDEIDLWQLAAILWGGKYWIVLFIALSVLAGSIYLINAEEEWVSKAQVITPSFKQHQKITGLIYKLKPAFGSDFADRIDAIKLNSSAQTFERFIVLYNSDDRKKTFLQSHPIFATYLENHANKQQILNQWAESIQAISDEIPPKQFDLTFASWTANGSYTLLLDYVNFINDEVSKEFEDNFKMLALQRSSELKQNLKILERNAKLSVSRNIELLSHSLVIATAANIQSPIVDPGTSDEFAINLGAKAIEAKIQQLKSIKNFAIIDPEILVVQNQFSALEDLELGSLSDFKTFEFTETPTQPLSRKSPKRLLVILGCTILGGILGAIGALLAHAVRVHNAEHLKN